MSKEELLRASPYKKLAFPSHIFSWYLIFLMGIASMLLISGTLANSKSRKDCGIDFCLCVLRICSCCRAGRTKS
ncbi:hypothetical protein F511_32612 [Dorcoceras hygrometricum]|uniref:Uncharacterized protein n=1 Tax=Dorcoceras hygrometricum TaxID=472368 RepID=A0A2Z7BT28_9LAMI|nr:hypothetical protein F511_32612 [Dorcoceras hygrometricum]